METKQTEEKDILVVHTLGDFRMTWNGKAIVSGARDSQFIRLMEILIHSGSQGLPRATLEDLLFDNSNSDDPGHLLRSVIYNAKKKLQKAGLPDVNYIVFRDGAYYWTDEISVSEDAREFEQLVREAGQETDPQKKADLYQQACYQYTGEFLPHQTSLIWVVQEDLRYRDMFCECMEQAVEGCRNAGDYREMERLGRYASKILPLSEWEGVTLEALLSLEQHEKAMEFYDKTVELYMKELGVQPSFDIKEMIEKFGGKIQRGHSKISDIQKRLTEDDDMKPGGTIYSYPVFEGVYRMVQRMLERGGQSVYLMLCTLVDGKGKAIEDSELIEKLTPKLESAICKSIRRSDAACRYGNGQYLILLINISQEKCSIIENRINNIYKSGRQRTGVKYSISAVKSTGPLQPVREN